MTDAIFLHTTDKEIEFLRGIPDGRWKAGTSRTQAMKALTRYRQTLRNRRWVGDVDVEKVDDFAGMLLAEIDRGNA